ncbi:type II toxin-antitoxin system RelE/ParE family toxin [Coraliomargarita sp. SDUM461003]|uniref:Type II toxin-antitoxin system RelE/ParE family toxin n=1 Tax=Thalassobacterium maritimum TaxID=3041265 RepID=A0ABU1B1I8_9BACT|nr:type II toxin-antitoxin system RelE/ParE family toxin [Coraliomargarita sp. SDUM461003]MDQ8209559.1 type II toxin-antitoxin system RelE/ParE family toxin [Coraliomargarita sp. SDUM461003]
MELKVVWTDPAIKNLRDIRNYIAEDNPAAAVSF